MKYNVLPFIFVFATGYAIARYTTPVKTETIYQNHTVEVEKIKEDKNINENTKIIKIKKPDGTIVTTLEKNKIDLTKITTDKNTDSKSIESEVVKNKTDTLIVSALISTSFSSIVPVYGLEISKNLIGPFRLGLVGFNNKTAGISLGIQL